MKVWLEGQGGGNMKVWWGAFALLGFQRRAKVRGSAREGQTAFSLSIAHLLTRFRVEVLSIGSGC